MILATLYGLFMIAVQQGEAMKTAANCTISPERRISFLQLEAHEFDQTTAGWRSVARENCYPAAEGLIADYILFSPQLTSADQDLRSLRFHAGQMAAFSNQNRKAVEYFRGSLNQGPVEVENVGLFDWNSYVLGTIAFLERDRDSLQNHRNELATPEKSDANKLNRSVLEGYLACFDETYAEAYGNKNCQASYSGQNSGD